VYVDTTSSLPSLVQRVAGVAAAREVRVVDAPLTGGTTGAASGELTFIAGGEPDALEAAAPVLDVLGKRTFHMGPVGSGCAAKLVNNMIGQVQVHSFAEALALATKFGLDVGQVVELLGSADTGSGILTKYLAAKGLRGDFEPGFTVDLAFKDQTLIAELGRELGVPLHFNALVLQRIAETRARGFGGLDHTAALLPLEELLGVRIRFEPSPE
jgi:3-hydroxyisobutyrate dehydrogenase-like beta-hydroxyacid dehydrogenase